MREPFRVVVSQGASYLTAEEQNELMVLAVREAEKLRLKDQYVIFDDPRGLKVVVRWEEREVWIMTGKEADAGGLPSPSDN